MKEQIKIKSVHVVVLMQPMLKDTRHDKDEIN